MPAIEVDIEIFCAGCGEGLCNQSTPTRTAYRQQPAFQVEPCERCLSAAEERGYEAGYTKAEENSDASD